MLTRWTLGCWLLLLSTAILASADDPQIANLGYAQYQGTFNPSTNVTSFFGIRFAAPPVGDLRFQAPRPPLSLEGVQLANELPAICFGTAYGTLPNNPFSGLSKRATPSQSEDCLYLNVFVSGSVNPGSKMPVVVWIHGGGYTIGSAADTDGGDLIRGAGGGIIAVTIQYRLGMFGFLAGSVVKERGALNAGLLDQRAALEWVQQHIHTFGGDPTQVTIWGVSAGAGSVMQHMIADGGDTQPPLFRAAILSSLFMPPQFKFDDPIPERIFLEAAQLSGCANSTDIFTCLVGLDENALQNVNVQVNNNAFYGTFTTVPVVDGEFIRDRPTKIIQSGKLNGELLFTMNNQVEGRLFVNSIFSTLTTMPAYVQELFPGLSRNQSELVASLYQVPGFNVIVEQTIEIIGDSIFVCPTYTMLRYFRGPSYKGAFPGDHGGDSIFYFPTLAQIPLPFENPQFIASFSESFLAVVKSFNPNVKPNDPNNITPEWNTYSDGNFEMRFGATDDGQAIVKPFTTDAKVIERCRIWESLAPFTMQ